MSCLLVPLLAAGALADYPYYTDYTDYNSVYSPAAVANLSRLSRATKNQRTWDPSGPFTVTLEPSISIPLPDLDSSLLLELPFTWEFGGEAARRGGHFQGRSGKTEKKVYQPWPQYANQQQDSSHVGCSYFHSYKQTK